MSEFKPLTMKQWEEQQFGGPTHEINFNTGYIKWNMSTPPILLYGGIYYNDKPWYVLKAEFQKYLIQRGIEP